MSATRRAATSRGSFPTPTFADLVDELERALRLRLRESPAVTLALGAGAGFILGGGLTLGVLSRAAQLGLRFVLADRAEQMLAEWVTMGRRTEESPQASNPRTGDRR